MACIPDNVSEVYVPTMTALKIGTVHHGFIVNHDPTNPTHKFDWCPLQERPCLSPLRTVKVGQEFTFHYGMDNEGAPNYPTKPNP